MLGGVIGHKIDDHLEIALVGLLDKSIECLQVTEDGIDIAVIANVVTKVGHWGGIEGRELYSIHPEPAQVFELGNNALQITDTIAIAVFETAGVNLVNHAWLPPRQGMRGHKHSFYDLARSKLFFGFSQQ